MTFQNKTVQKIISCLLIITILSPAGFVLLSKPQKSEAIFGIADIVIDPAQIFEMVKEFILMIIKQFLMAVVRKLLDKITQATVNWINGGFHGKPLFVVNASFFKDIAQQQVKGIIGDIGYNRFKFPFGKDYALSLIGTVKNQFKSNAESSYSSFALSNQEFDYRLQNFSAGGWSDFYRNTQLPQNNFIGFGMLADNQLSQKLTGPGSPVQKIKDKLAQGAGFLSQEGCKSNPFYDPDKLNEGYHAPTFVPPDTGNSCLGLQDQEYDQCIADLVAGAQNAYNATVATGQADFLTQYGCKEGPSNLTPGSTIAGQILKATGTKFAQSELGAALGNSLAAIFDALLNHFMQKGLTALADLVSPPPDPNSVDFSNYGYYGDTSGGYLGNPPSSFNNSTLTVTSNVVNDDGGVLLDPSLAKIYVDGNETASGGSITTPSGGQHNVYGANIDGYYITVSGDCDSNGNVFFPSTGGVTKSCLVTFDDIPTGATGKLTVHVSVINSNGGTLNANSVPLFIDNIPKIHDFEYLYRPGVHTVTETIPSGYTAAISGDCSTSGVVTVGVDTVNNCYIVFSDGGTSPPPGGGGDLCPLVTGTQTTTPCASSLCQSGTYWNVGSQACLVQPNSGNNGNLTVTLIINGGPLNPNQVQLYVDNTVVGNNVSNPFSVGQHVISEAGASGYNTIIGGDCTASGFVVVDANQPKNCVVTNNWLSAKLTLTAEVINDSGGTLDLNNVLLYLDGNLITIGDINTVAVGSHVFSGALSSGGIIQQNNYTATISGDCNPSNGSITLALDEQKACKMTFNDN